MDNLQVLSGSSRSSSRSASPGRPLQAMLGHSASPNAGGVKPPHPALRSSEGSSVNSGSVPGSGEGSASSSTRHRRKSPIMHRREQHGADMNTPHLPHTDLLPARGGSQEYSSQSGSQDNPDYHSHPPTFLSNGSSEQVAGSDEADSQTDIAKQRAAAIEHIQNKISRTKEQIRAEQTTRDDNVNEYLKLAAHADKQQIQRIKSVFEKKNTKSAQIISQLQKKLEGYNKRIKEIESQRLYSSHRQPREVLRDVGQGLKHVGGNIRDGISGFSGGVVENIKGGLHGAAETVMAKPREFAHLLKNKFGSADNINALSRSEECGSTEEEKTHHGSATLPGNCSLSTTGTPAPVSGGAVKFASDEGSPCSSVTSESLPPGSAGQTTHHAHPTPLNLEVILQELRERREELDLLKENMERWKGIQQELLHAIQEERFRSERLEEQVNDLTELHQNEVENLKQTLTDMEEKVQYQSEERLRDIHEMLETCQTKMSKMEHQQAQHQQYVTLEGIDNSNARALVVKLINVLLTVLQVVLLLVATAAGILMPFLKTRLRILSTLVLIAAMVFVVKQWPELRDVGHHLLRYMKEVLSVK